MTRLLGRDRDQVVLDLPVAERPEDLVGDERSRRWPLRDARRASNETNHRSPLRVAHREAGRERRPASAATTVQVPGAGPVAGRADRARPRRSTPARARMRLVNQLESGTSSMVLMLRARTFGVESPGRREQVVARSKMRSMSHGCDARGVLRLGLARERVVVVELAPVRRPARCATSARR